MGAQDRFKVGDKVRYKKDATIEGVITNFSTRYQNRVYVQTRGGSVLGFDYVDIERVQKKPRVQTQTVIDIKVGDKVRYKEDPGYVGTVVSVDENGIDEKKSIWDVYLNVRWDDTTGSTNSVPYSSIEKVPPKEEPEKEFEVGDTVCRLEMLHRQGTVKGVITSELVGVLWEGGVFREPVSVKALKKVASANPSTYKPPFNKGDHVCLKANPAQTGKVITSGAGWALGALRPVRAWVQVNWRGMAGTPETLSADELMLVPTEYAAEPDVEPEEEEFKVGDQVRLKIDNKVMGRVVGFKSTRNPKRNYKVRVQWDHTGNTYSYLLHDVEKIPEHLNIQLKGYAKRGRPLDYDPRNDPGVIFGPNTVYAEGDPAGEGKADSDPENVTEVIIPIALMTRLRDALESRGIERYEDDDNLLIEVAAAVLKADGKIIEAASEVLKKQRGEST